MIRRLLLLSILAAFSLPALQAQTQINPITQVDWTKLTGSGVPTLTCTADQYGQQYTDITASPNAQYVCGVGGWLNLISASSGSGTLSGQVPGFAVCASSATAATGPCALDFSVTTAATATLHEGFAVDDGSGKNGSAALRPGTGTATPAAGYAIVSQDGSGNGTLSNNGGAFSPICTAGSGVCSTVSVKTFGAVGNGSTDDYAAIMRGVDAVVLTGGTLFFPCGTYYSSQQIQIVDLGTGSNYVGGLVGDNASCSFIKVVPATSVGAAFTYSAASSYPMSAPVWTAPGFRMENLSIIGTSNTTYALGLYGINNSSFRHVWLSGTSTTAGACLYSYVASINTFDDIECDGGAYNGIVLDGYSGGYANSQNTWIIPGVEGATNIAFDCLAQCTGNTIIDTQFSIAPVILNLLGAENTFVDSMFESFSATNGFLVSGANNTFINAGLAGSGGVLVSGTNTVFTNGIFAETGGISITGHGSQFNGRGLISDSITIGSTAQYTSFDHVAFLVAPVVTDNSTSTVWRNPVEVGNAGYGPVNFPQDERTYGDSGGVNDNILEVSGTWKSAGTPVIVSPMQFAGGSGNYWHAQFTGKWIGVGENVPPLIVDLSSAAPTYKLASGDSVTFGVNSSGQLIMTAPSGDGFTGRVWFEISDGPAQEFARLTGEITFVSSAGLVAGSIGAAYPSLQIDASINSGKVNISGNDGSGNIATFSATKSGTSVFTIPTTGIPIIPGIKSTTGDRFVCVDSSGNLVSSATACSGT